MFVGFLGVWGDKISLLAKAKRIHHKTQIGLRLAAISLPQLPRAWILRVKCHPPLQRSSQSLQKRAHWSDQDLSWSGHSPLHPHPEMRSVSQNKVHEALLLRQGLAVQPRLTSNGQIELEG